MVDLNTPVTPDTTPVPSTPVTPAPTAPVMNTTSPVQPAPKKKNSKLVLLILLLIIAAGFGYYTFFMNKTPEPAYVAPVVVDTGMDMDNLPTATGMMNTDTTGDALSGTTALREDTDMTRKLDILDMASALDAYFAVNSLYPMAEGFENSLLMYVSTLPVDPNSTVWTSFNNTQVSGYVYSPLMRAGKANTSYLLMARTTTPEGSNWIDEDPALSKVSNISRADAAAIEKMICSTITVDETTVDSLKNCTAKMGSDKLRYIYIK